MNNTSYFFRWFLPKFLLGRAQLLKRAKEEAVHEVEAFKLEKEKAYKALEQQVS